MSESRARIAGVVCTYNRCDLLKMCLDSLVAQTLPWTEFELVVVDNNSTDATGKVVAEYARRHPNLRLLHEPRQGLSVARNTGIDAVTAPIAAFLDDDAVAEPDWLERLAARFDQLGPDVAIVGGDIDPVWGAPPPKWLNGNMIRAASGGLNWSSVPRFVDGRREWVFEGASAYRVGAIRALGGFPEQLGRIGNVLLSGESAIHYRMIENDLKVFYDPTIRVRHFIPAARLTKAWFRQRYFWQGVSGFVVDEYLRAHGAEAPLSVRVELPANESAWVVMFDDTAEANFERSLGLIYNLGYTLAAQGVVVPR